MGTSKSSTGAPSGVPMVPPWTPDPDTGEVSPIGEVGNVIDDNAQPVDPAQPKLLRKDGFGLRELHLETLLPVEIEPHSGEAWDGTLAVVLVVQVSRPGASGQLL